MNRPSTLQAVACLLIAASLVTQPTIVHADEIDDAKKRVNEFFETGAFTVKVDLDDAVGYVVTPDGTPPESYEPRGRKSGKLAFHAGDRGTGIYIGVNERHKLISVKLQKKRTRLPWRAAGVNIGFRRKLTPADIDPRVIARALSAYVEFDGLEVGQEIDDALAQLDSAAVVPVATPPPTTITRPTVLTLAVTATPQRVRGGEDVILELEYQVQAPATQSVGVMLRRTLRLDGKALPGYPTESTEELAAGTHNNRYRQPIPKSARAGTYEFRCEVCVGGDCISRTVTFTVESRQGYR